MLNFCRKIIMISGLLFVLVYLFYGIYLGKMTEEIMLAAMEEYYYVENNPYSDIISDEDYNKMNFRSRMNFEIPNSYDCILMKRPFVIHWFTGANVWINHDYYFYSGNTLMTGLTEMDNKFTLKLQDGQWKITGLKLGISLTGG